MSYEGPGAGFAAAGSVVVLVLGIVVLVLPLLAGVGLLLWLAAREVRRKLRAE